MEITTASSDDADRVVDLWVALARDQRAHGSQLLAEANRDAIREAVFQRIVADDLLLADESGETIGFVMATIEQGRYEQALTRGLVENIYVVPEHRREGVGGALLRAAERHLAESGADTVALEAMADNEAARSFYADHGYELHRVELTKPTESDTL
ncbi:GNAT family N-acetyltransferase [Haloarcula litorea]|uniref:GNAT family N-acetyltransferase n=1 Tax=Haloarcula litorea TaxID=3032579 RepID=UPI0023E76639|nr:GNAT family N-acetyltransferase [Halomicroarcula sp. GDY20]